MLAAKEENSFDGTKGLLTAYMAELWGRVDLF